MQCNIDARGKVARLIWGILLMIIGIVLAVIWAVPNSSPWPWVVTAIVVLAGAFAVFEARAGWCVMRAMGFKTPI